MVQTISLVNHSDKCLPTRTVVRVKCSPINPIRASADAGLHRSICIPFTFRTRGTVHRPRVNPMLWTRRMVVRILRSPRSHGARGQINPKHRCESRVDVWLDELLWVILDIVCPGRKPSIQSRLNKRIRRICIPNLSKPCFILDHPRGRWERPTGIRVQRSLGCAVVVTISSPRGIPQLTIPISPSSCAPTGNTPTGPLRTISPTLTTGLPTKFTIHFHGVYANT